MAGVDSLTAAIQLGDSCILNFANARHPGGGYWKDSLAQEEDLCRLMPQLQPSLHEAKANQGFYPIRLGFALMTTGLFAICTPGTY